MSKLGKRRSARGRGQRRMFIFHLGLEDYGKDRYHKVRKCGRQFMTIEKCGALDLLRRGIYQTKTRYDIVGEFPDTESRVKLEKMQLGAKARARGGDRRLPR